MRFLKYWDKVGIYALTAITFLICTALLGSRFASVFNMLNVLMQICLIVVGGVGITFIITCGLTDMSIGSIYTMTSIVSGIALTKLNLGVGGAVTLSLLMGSLCGIINGLLVAKGKLPPFITTLATMLAFKGASYLISGGKDITYMTYTGFKQISAGRLWGIPNPILIMLLLVIGGYLVYKYTRFGVYVRSVGSNSVVTETSGIPVDRVIILCYICSGIFASLGGLLSASRTLIGTSTAGATYSIDCICAVVLGGTSMSGGKGSVIGMAFAALLLGFMENVLNMLNLPFYYQYIVTGIILVFALIMSNLRSLLLERKI